MPWSIAAAATARSSPSGTGTRSSTARFTRSRARCRVPGPRHAVADRETLHAVPDCGHGAGALGAGRERRGDRVEPFALVGVDEVHADRGDRHLDLAGPGVGHLDVAHLEDRGVAVAGDGEGLWLQSPASL